MFVLSLQVCIDLVLTQPCVHVDLCLRLYNLAWSLCCMLIVEFVESNAQLHIHLVGSGMRDERSTFLH